MQHMLTGVTARYPRLNSTYRFDNGENKSVKCDPFDDGAAYEMSFVMSDETAKELHNLCLEAYKNASALDAKRKWPEKPSMLPYKRNDEGEVVGKCKLKGAYGGDKTQPPKQVDAARNKLPDDFMLTTGSKCNVAVVVVPYNTGSINGVSLRLRAVQVLELAEVQGSDDPFTAVSGGFTASAANKNDDPFGLPATSATTATPSINDLDDEIPF
jgi:hypothetical protein